MKYYLEVRNRDHAKHPKNPIQKKKEKSPALKLKCPQKIPKEKRVPSPKKKVHARPFCKYQ